MAETTARSSVSQFRRRGLELKGCRVIDSYERKVDFPQSGSPRSKMVTVGISSMN